MAVFIWRALAVDLLLVILEGAVPGLGWMLPIGGSHLAQVGFCLGMSIVYFELVVRLRLEDSTKTTHKDDNK